MARSYKKQVVVKDNSTYFKTLGDKRMRRKTKHAILKELDPPIDKSEVMQDYDVTDWRWHISKHEVDSQGVSRLPQYLKYKRK